jgi:hypothetical protein
MRGLQGTFEKPLQVSDGAWGRHLGFQILFRVFSYRVGVETHRADGDERNGVDRKSNLFPRTRFQRNAPGESKTRIRHSMSDSPA